MRFGNQINQVGVRFNAIYSLQGNQTKCKSKSAKFVLLYQTGSHVTTSSQSASTVWYNPHPLLVQLVLRQTPRAHPFLVQLVPRQNVRLHPLQQRLALTVAAWGADK